MRFIDGIPVWGDPVDEGALAQITRCRDLGAAHVAMMADHHKGYAVPIGGVVAYRDHVSPSGVGYDIACGNKAVCLDATLADIKDDISKIMDEIWANIVFGIGGVNPEQPDHELFDDDPAWEILESARKSGRVYKDLKLLARNQLGTIGSGNHYVDIFADEDNRIWVGVHFGSRGLGHKITTMVLDAAGGKDGMDVDPVVIHVGRELGQDYIACMGLAGRYAYAGRDWVCERVASIIGARIVSEVHNHHNFSWHEEHGGEMLWVVRKGATPAFPGQKGFVGASMAEPSVILEGVESVSGADSLYSTVHGAGRVMGRMQAKGKVHRKTGRVIREGKVSPEMMSGWVSKARVELRGAGLDESPDCYKRLNEVLKHHEKSTRILHWLTPVGVAMAGDGR